MVAAEVVEYGSDKVTAYILVEDTKRQTPYCVIIASRDQAHGAFREVSRSTFDRHIIPSIGKIVWRLICSDGGFFIRQATASDLYTTPPSPKWS